MNPVLTKQQLLRWLREDDPNELEALWKWANEIRRGFVGDSVHLRGLVEISNHCTRSCLYCASTQTLRSASVKRTIDFFTLITEPSLVEFGSANQR